MPRPRSVVACLMLSLSGGVTTSCVSVLGLDEEHDSAVERYCKCDAVKALRNGDYADCVSYFTSRLNAASEPARAAWMKKYAEACDKCLNWDQCIDLPATCTREGDPCLDTLACVDCCTDTAAPGPCQASS